MKDNVPKGTGNSRYLKSAISSSTTWEQFRTMLMNGTLPVDMDRINAAGWQVLGDALNKANLLPDSLASALGLTGNPQVKDALSKLAGKVNLAAGFYAGTGTFGAGYPKVLTFPFVPKVLYIRGTISGSNGSYPATGLWVNGTTVLDAQIQTGSSVYSSVVTISGTIISWYYDSPKYNRQFNVSNKKYYYYLLG